MRPPAPSWWQTILGAEPGDWVLWIPTLVVAALLTPDAGWVLAVFALVVSFAFGHIHGAHWQRERAELQRQWEALMALRGGDSASRP